LFAILQADGAPFRIELQTRILLKLQHDFPMAIGHRGFRFHALVSVGPVTAADAGR
jgi:hypothetical protein